MLFRGPIAHFLAALAVFACAGELFAGGSDGGFGFPIVKTYTQAEMGGGGVASSFTRLRDGTLVVGGDKLYTFDGERWMRSRPEGGLTAIYWLDLGSDGRIWAAAEGDAGWFDQQSDGTWMFHSLRPKISTSEPIIGQVWKIFACGSATVFSTKDRVYRWDGRKMESWFLPGSQRLTLFRIDGNIYIGDMRHGLYRLDETGPTLAIPQSAIGPVDKDLILWLDAQPDRWVFATGAGLSEYRPGQATSTPIAPATSAFLNEQKVTCGARLPDGRFVFGTLKSGMIVTDGDFSIIERLDEKDGVPPYICAFLPDADGQLWVASPSGVQRINLNPATRIFDQRSGLATLPYGAMAHSDNLIVTANRNGVLMLDSDRKHFSPLPQLRTQAHELSSTNKGVIIGAFGHAWLFNRASAAVITARKGDYCMGVVSRIHPDEYLVTDFDGAVDVVSSDLSARHLVVQSPVGIRTLAEGNDGLLWMGTPTQGVFIAPREARTPSRPIVPPAHFGLPKITGFAHVSATPAGDILVISAHGGWIKNGGTGIFRPIPHYPDRPAVNISFPLPDGSIWLLYGKNNVDAAGIARITGGRNPEWQPYSFADFDAIGDPTSLTADQDEEGRPVIWIGGTKAVLRHVVVDKTMARPPSSPLLTAFIRNENGVKESLAETIPYSSRSIDFEFAETDYAHRAQIRLQTRLSGIDSSWVPAGPDSIRNFTGLRDGAYTFEVRAVAGTGLISEPTVLSFRVLPPWWRSPTALWSEVIALVLLIYGGVQWRMRALRRRNEHLEQKVQERTEELAEASAAKTQFVANMSHDIRNPLNGIVGLAIALEDTPLDAQQRELIATLRECTTYLSSLVDDVLDFASIEAGRIELRPTTYVPAELLNSVVTTLKSECSARGAFITIETDPDIPPMLRGDAGRIQQILVNYVSNALKYAGGHIRLCAAVSPSDPGEVEFAVADEGAGISEAEQKTLFTKFARLADARRSQIPGTGLGLASCRLLADIMGGSVGVESQLNHGSRFYLRLPLVVATEPLAVKDDFKLPPTTVLLVEDTDYNALAAKAVLAKLGLPCDRASTGAEAIKLFAERRHHIVLLDRNLPDMDGTEVAGRLRELETDGLHSVLLAVTAYCTAEDRQICLDAGMDAFVGKPLTPEKLRKVLLGAANQLLGGGLISAPATPTPTAAPTSETKVDLALLEYLAEGGEGGVAAQTERFIVEINAAYTQLIETRERNDFANLGDAAHRVLGNARMVGASRLTELLIQLETAARKSDLAAFDGTLPQIMPEIGGITEALRRHPLAQRA